MQILKLVWFWFGLTLNVPVNSYGHVGMVCSPNTTFICASLTKRVISGREENGHRHYYMINLRKSMGLGSNN